MTFFSDHCSRYKTDPLTFLFHIHFLACPLGSAFQAAVPKRIAYFFFDMLTLPSVYDAYLFYIIVINYQRNCAQILKLSLFSRPFLISVV